MDIIEVKDLVKRYRELVAVDNFSLAIKPGEIFGLLGPNGSGKTTVINCILQLLTYDRGEICLFGEPMSPSRYDLKRRIGIVPQNIAVFSQLNVAENIDYFCSLYVDDRARRRALVDEAIEFVGLEDYRRFRPRKLSGGLIRRLNIACGIVHQPELIIFDEPTVAVDPQSRNAILEGIQRLNERGSTVIYTSHYMQEVEQICTRIMIMDHGQALATGTNSELKALVGINERMEIELAELGEPGGADGSGGPDGTAGLGGPDRAGEADGFMRPGDKSAAALRLVRALPHVATAQLEGSLLRVTCSAGAHNLSDILGALQKAGILYGRVFSEPPTLNDVFLEITGKELRD
ncbi:MAG: ABC transporter ATP-binding protein [Coriobacteriia bacterium]|nr:ABC transporter ATP-binding protein [Coriobacteriia bacterium]